MKYGFKVWSNNFETLEVLQNRKLWDHYSFMELYAIPGSFDATISFWKKFDIPFVIHAPHFAHGFNLSLAEKQETNLAFLAESHRFCQALGSDKMIVHLGTKGTLEESLRQLKPLNFKEILIENKPQIALDESRCIGAAPQEIEAVLKTCPVGFCFDISHAIAYAAHAEQNYLEVLKTFFALKPKHFHLCDGLMKNKIDKHFSIGKGDYDFKAIMPLLPKDAVITLETPKKSDTPVELLIAEVEALRKYE